MGYTCIHCGRPIQLKTKPGVVIPRELQVCPTGHCLLIPKKP